MQIMIVLHRRKEDPYADDLEGKLRDLVVAYRTAIHEERSSGSESLPCIHESGKIISGKDEISQYLVDLEKELAWQRSLSGDGCYIDPESGEVC
jgi:hypothetical protein